MPNKYVAIMNIGSSKINVMIGKSGVNNTFFIKGKGEAEYAGFYDGEFLEPEKLGLAIGLAISNAEASADLPVDMLYVGVPADFSYVETHEVEELYPKKKKIKIDDLKLLYSKAVNKQLLKEKILISCSGMWFRPDDGRKMFDVLNQKVCKLECGVSLLYVESKFIKTINDILGELAIQSVEYISTPLAETQYLLTQGERDRKAIILDCDYISTTVAEAYGDGLMALNSFSIGGGHITADLSELLGLSFSSAESLKNEIVLSINSKRNDCYEIYVENEVLPVPITSTNQIVCSRIEMIGSLIRKCLEINFDENSEIGSVYLTGSGLSYINGARDYLSKCLGMTVKMLTPEVPSMEKPHLASSLSVLYVALEKQKSAKLSKLKKIFNI